MSQKTQSSSSEMIALGEKWECFSCGAKFYDLGKSPVVCPKCNADQEENAAAEATPTKKIKKKKKKKKKQSKKASDEEE